MNFEFYMAKCVQYIISKNGILKLNSTVLPSSKGYISQHNCIATADRAVVVHCMFACWWLIVLMSADRQTDKKTYRLTDRQTGRETYRQTDTHTDIQTVPFP